MSSTKLDDMSLSAEENSTSCVMATADSTPSLSTTTMKTSPSGTELDWVRSLETVPTPFAGKKANTPEKAMLDCCREEQPLNRFNPAVVQQFQGGLRRTLSTSNMPPPPPQ